MNLGRAKVLLKKMNRLLEGMDSEDHLSAIERDLIRAYLRELYDQFLPDGDQSSSTSSKVDQSAEEKTSALEKGPSSPSSEEGEKSVEAEKEDLSIPRIKSDEQGEDEDRLEKDHSAASGQTASSSDASPAQQEEAESSGQQDSKTDASVSSDDDVDEEALEELFDVKEGNELSERLSHRPVRDISRAMGLNERIFTINELFGGDHALFDEVLKTLNELETFREARKYLTEKVAIKYDWTHADRKKKAHHFIQLVRRRFKKEVV